MTRPSRWRLAGRKPRKGPRSPLHRLSDSHAEEAGHDPFHPRRPSTLKAPHNTGLIPTRELSPRRRPDSWIPVELEHEVSRSHVESSFASMGGQPLTCDRHQAPGPHRTIHATYANGHVRPTVFPFVAYARGQSPNAWLLGHRSQPPIRTTALFDRYPAPIPRELVFCERSSLKEHMR